MAQRRQQGPGLIEGIGLGGLFDQLFPGLQMVGQLVGLGDHDDPVHRFRRHGKIGSQCGKVCHFMRPCRNRGVLIPVKDSPRQGLREL
ncbi:hypothetical protein D3C77_652720 [compost metagenome]